MQPEDTRIPEARVRAGAPFRMHVAALAVFMAVAFFMTRPACAENARANINAGRTTESYTAGNFGYLTVSGTVSKVVDRDRFDLNYGNGEVRVDCDDALYELLRASGRKIRIGDKVTVSGKIDDQWFTRREMLASTLLYMAGKDIVLYKRPGDIAGGRNASPPPEGQAALTGIVTDIVYKGDFTLRYEDGTIQVKAFDIKIPDRDRIVKGDVVTVYGRIDNSFFSERKITAETVEKIGVYSRTSSGGR